MPSATETFARDAEKMRELLQRVLDKDDQYFALEKGQEAAMAPKHLLMGSGLIYLRDVRVGIGVGTSVCCGSGFIMRKIETNHGHERRTEWSAPLPFTNVGGSIGIVMGFSLSHSLLLLRTQEHVDMFLKKSQFAFGLEAALKVGGWPRQCSESKFINEKPWSKFTVLMTDGWWDEMPLMWSDCETGILIDVSLKGARVEHAVDLMTQLYGTRVAARPRHILDGTVPPPHIAAPLYHALEQTTPKWDMTLQMWTANEV